MEIKGTLSKILDPQTGTGKNGNWIRRSFLIETPGQYSKTVQIQAFGDKGDILDQATEGEELTISFDLESREFNGKYYTSVNAYKIEIAGVTAPKPPGPKPATQVVFEPSEESSDLPF